MNLYKVNKIVIFVILDFKFKIKIIKNKSDLYKNIYTRCNININLRINILVVLKERSTFDVDYVWITSTTCTSILRVRGQPIHAKNMINCFYN